MNRLSLLATAFAAVITVGVPTASAQDNTQQMSIRVAGYEVLLNGSGSDDHHNDHEWWGERSNPNWRHKDRHGYAGRIGLLEVGQPFLRSYGDSYAAYPVSERGFMDLSVWKSDYVALNLFTFSSPLVRRGWLGATMALGFAYNGYSLDTPAALVKIDRMLHPVASEHSFKKSKIRSWWMHVPLVFEINPNRHFFISAGGYMDMMFWSSAKWKSPKQKLSDPYINQFQIGLTARVGFRDIYFFGKYSLSPFFQPDKGPRLNQYTIGLGINL